MSRESSGPIVITGPTASGKGALAFELARRLSGEIVSLDSMKLYRELDIATAKPTADRRSAVRYHLLDLLEPDREFSTGEYLPLLERTLAEIVSRGRRPILSGGTALYLKGFLDGFQAGPEANWDIRTRLLQEATEVGSERLHQRLSGLDPRAAQKIHPNDSRRVVRALEVLETTGRPISGEWSWNARAPRPEGVRVFGLDWPREELYARIDLRVERMVEAGLFEEAARLRQRTPPLGRTAAQSIGVKEVWEALDLARPRREIVEQIQRRTRRFAKSQLTWFRKMPVEWIPVSGAPQAEDLAGEIIRLLQPR